MPVGGGRARAGLEIDHSEPQARVWRSRGRAAAHRHTQRPGPPAPGTPVGATSNPAQQAADNGYDSETSPRGSRRDRPR